MNKEFKFWCKGTSSNPNFNKKGWWVFPNYLLSKYYGGLSIFESEDFVSCQSTGLTDSTGKKIFEGDIVDYRYDGMSKFEKERYSNLLVSPVYWEYERWRIKYSAESYAWHLMKVIGNIFETPELLKL